MTEAGEQWPGCPATYGGPRRECRGGLGEGVLAVSDADDLAVAFGVGLGTTHHEEQSAGSGLDVGESEPGQLRRRSAEAKPRRMIAASRTPLGVARSMPVTIWRISATPSGRAWAARRGAQGTAQAPAHETDSLVHDRVTESLTAMDVGDGGAGHVEDSDRGTLAGAFGQVGADRGRGCRERRDLAGGAPAFPGAPGVGVDGPGGVGEGHAHRRFDPGCVSRSQAGERIGRRSRHGEGAGVDWRQRGGHPPVVAASARLCLTAPIEDPVAATGRGWKRRISAP
jgi:hypothetical protein